MNNFKPKLAFTCYHSGGLKEALDTEKPIKLSTAFDLIKSGIYRFYGYDDRIGAQRYILSDFDYPSCVGLPTWINLYESRQNHHIDNGW